MADNRSDDIENRKLDDMEQESNDRTCSEESPVDKGAENGSYEELSSDEGEAESEVSEEVSSEDEDANNESSGQAAEAAYVEDSEWQCDVCMKRFKNEQYLKAHIKTHKRYEKKSKERCDICHVDFTTKAQLQLHAVLHDPSRPFVCEVCNLRYKDRMGLRDHKKSHKRRVVTFCTVCGLQCDTMNILHHHMKKHSDKKDFQCRLCEKKYKTKRYLKAHLQTCGTASQNQQLLQCHLCEKVYKKEHNLQVHLETWHKDETTEVDVGPPYNCDQCSKSYDLKIKLMQHKRQHIKQYKCPLCDFSSRANKDLEKHLLTHNRTQGEDKRYVVPRNDNKDRRYLICPYCNQEFERDEVFAHIKTVHGKDTHVCSVCDKEFRTRHQLKAHMAVHTSDRPFTCEICGASHKSKNYLNTHMRMHRTPQQPNCKLCGKFFSCANTMYSHMRYTHRHWQCSHCGKIFKRQSEYRKHMLGHELEKKFGQALGGPTSGFEAPPSTSESKKPLSIKPELEESSTPKSVSRDSTEPSGYIEICPENAVQHRDVPMDLGFDVDASSNASITSPSATSNSNTVESSEDGNYMREETNTADIDSCRETSVRSHGIFAEISRAFAKSQPCAGISGAEESINVIPSDHDAAVLQIVPVTETFESPKEGSNSRVDESDYRTKKSISEVGLPGSSGAKSTSQKENSNLGITPKSQNAESEIATTQSDNEKSDYVDTDADDTEDSDTDFDDMENPLNDDSDIENSDIDSENEDADSMEYDTDIGDTDVEMESDDTDIADADVNDKTTDKCNNGEIGISNTDNASDGDTKINDHDDTDAAVSASKKTSEEQAAEQFGVQATNTKDIYIDKNFGGNSQRVDKQELDLDNADESVPESHVGPENPSIDNECSSAEPESPSVGPESPSVEPESPSREESDDNISNPSVKDVDNDVSVSLNDLNNAELSLDGENGSVTFVIDYDDTGALVVRPVIK